MFCSFSPNKPRSWPLLFYSLNLMYYIINVGLHVKHCGFVRRKIVHSFDTNMMSVRNLLTWVQQTMGGLDYLIKQDKYILRIQIINKTCLGTLLLSSPMLWLGTHFTRMFGSVQTSFYIFHFLDLLCKSIPP